MNNPSYDRIRAARISLSDFRFRSFRGMKVKCQSCDAIGNVALTVVIFQPTQVAAFLGIRPKREIIAGGVSWRGGQSGCNHQLDPSALEGFS